MGPTGERKRRCILFGRMETPSERQMFIKNLTKVAKKRIVKKRIRIPGRISQSKHTSKCKHHIVVSGENYKVYSNA